MAGNIFVLNGDDITELRETMYENEDLFQRLIERYPNILAGEQINPAAPRKWVLIAREMGVPSDGNNGDRWSLDHLFADQDAIPTFVEVKRSTDTRIRREVVAQMLDYAANGTEYWTIDKIRLSFNAANGTLAEFGITTDEGEEEYWRLFESNLKSGKIRMLFVADVIPIELRRIIEFLNDQMKNSEVLGLEIKQYTSGQSLSTLVPRIVGQSAKAMDVKDKTLVNKVQWDEDSFFAEAVTISRKSTEICRKLIDWAKSNNLRIFGSSTVGNTNWGAGLLLWGSNYPLFNLYIYTKKIMIELPFQWFKPPLDADERQIEIVGRLNSIIGINVPKEKIHKRPSFLVNVLGDDSALEMFIAVFDKVIADMDLQK
jgi:hypothetical protein